MRQVIILGLMTVAAFISTCFICAVRKTKSTTFSAWMEAEGWTLLMFIWFAYGMILLWREVIH